MKPKLFIIGLSSLLVLSFFKESSAKPSSKFVVCKVSCCSAGKPMPVCKKMYLPNVDNALQVQPTLRLTTNSSLQSKMKEYSKRQGLLSSDFFTTYKNELSLLAKESANTKKAIQQATDNQPDVVLVPNIIMRDILN
jgi:hypothetical protein